MGQQGPVGHPRSPGWIGFAQCWPTHLSANRTGHVFGSLLLDREASLVSISGADPFLRT